MRPDLTASVRFAPIVLAIVVAGVCPHSGRGFRAAFAESAPAAGDYVPTPPPNFPAGGVTVDEMLGGRLTVAQPMRRHDGAATTLGAELAGTMPTILTFNYSTCPMLCSLQLNALVAALPGMTWKVGKQFRIVTVVLDPDESLTTVQHTRAKYLAQLPSGANPDGWVFLTTPKAGDGTSIRHIADAVGFRYQYVPDRAEWAHPAALIFVSTTGRVTRYVYGVDLSAAELEASVVRAGLDETSTAAGFMLRCFHWNPDANNYSKVGASAMRYGAAAFIVLLLASLGVWRLLRRQPRASHAPVGVLRP